MTILSLESIENLKKLARQNTWEDSLEDEEFLEIDSYAGGNVDDAYYGGVTTGETNLARHILKTLEISWQ